jgi:hypothetical protein
MTMQEGTPSIEVATSISPSQQHSLRPEVNMGLFPQLEGSPQDNRAMVNHKSTHAAEENAINHSILFPGLKPKQAESGSSTQASPQLDLELSTLKNSILAHKPAFCSSSSVETVTVPLHPRMAEVMQELLPGALSLWGEGEANARYAFNFSVLEGESKIVGMYALGERQARIKKYKAKLKKWRALHPVSRAFEGRRQIAFAKVRRNGRFAAPLSSSTPST